MVRAILEGRKTVTRRVIKKDRIKPVLISDYRINNPDIPDSAFIKTLVSMPYEVGDILYIRETWRNHCEECGLECHGCSKRGYHYRASEKNESDALWHPSIHMPKEAARIFLKVTDVRVERLQDITIEQICREGVKVECPHVLNGEEKIYAFSQLWNSTIKKADIDLYGWNANPMCG